MLSNYLTLKKLAEKIFNRIFIKTFNYPLQFQIGGQTGNTKMDEAKENIKSAATSATNTPENSKMSFLAIGAGLVVAGLLTWGVYKACRYFCRASLEDNIKENKEKMAKSRSLLDKINENKETMK